MKILLDHKIDIIPASHLVVCEGFSDAQLIYRLIERQGIDDCNVGCPSKAGGHGDGKDAIASYLRAVRAAIELGKAYLKGILVIADCDDNEAKIFADISSALSDSGFPRPEKCFDVAGSPVKSGVFLIPGRARTGTLEHLLWDAALLQNPRSEECVSSFVQCMGVSLSDLKDNQVAKIRMSTLVGASCKDNPWASAATMWSDKGNPVPLDSPCFLEIVEFLRAFTSGIS